MQLSALSCTSCLGAPGRHSSQVAFSWPGSKVFTYKQQDTVAYTFSNWYEHWCHSCLPVSKVVGLLLVELLVGALPTASHPSTNLVYVISASTPPHLLPISPLSSNTWMATAVVLMASAPPRMMADVPGRFARFTANSATPSRVSTTCAAPMPNTYLAMLCNRSRLNSRPMLNSRNTTPISAKCCTACTSLMMLSACGPTRAPPICRDSKHTGGHAHS